MEQQVLFRDRQEMQAADLNNVQSFADVSFQHLINDAITEERMLVGLTVSMKSSTEIEIAPGRLWAGDLGKVFRKDEAETVSLFSMLPVADERWLAVSVIGQEQELNIEPRDMLVDLQTGQTEPSAVAMELSRVVVCQVQAGVESPDPQKPEPPTGYTCIGYVRLNTSGVQEIVLAENKRLMRLFDVWQQTTANADWISAITPKISTIMSDLAALAAKVKGIAYGSMLTQIAGDVALLKDYMELPDDYSQYGADNFLDADESDTDHVEYRARAEEGIRFPWANQYTMVPELFNPYETGVTVTEGFALPAYAEVRRLQITGYIGAMNLSQYTYQTNEMKQGTRTKYRYRFGPVREVCSNGANWRTGGYDFVTNIFEGPDTGFEVLEQYGEHNGHYWYRIREYWRDSYQEAYWYVDTINHTISGCQVAQTILNHAAGWLTSLGLYFTSHGADGKVHIHLCETQLGQPDPSRSVAYTSLDASELQTYPTETRFTFPTPVYLEPGKRYAIVITTGGNHSVALAQGTSYTQGTLFQSTDNVYYQGDNNKDIMFSLYYAQFTATRSEIQLKPSNLDGGIADFDCLLDAVIPENCDLTLEFQKDGKWYTLAAGQGDQLKGLPPLLPVRAVFLGSQDVMPGLGLAESRISVSRPDTTYTHFSTERILASPANVIDVQLTYEAWIAERHTCNCSLIIEGAELAAASVKEEDLGEDDNGKARIRLTYTFEPVEAVSSYVIKCTGQTASALECFHVAKRMDVARA